MSRDIDKIIKDKLTNREYKIPDSLNKKINLTLDSLDKIEKEKSKFNYKRLAVCAVLAFMIFSTIRVGAISMASGKSVKGIIFEDFGISKNYENYADEINKTKEENGIRFTVISTSYDNNDLTILYKIKLDKNVISQEEFDKLEVNKYLSLKGDNEHSFSASSGIYDIGKDGEMIGSIVFNDLDKLKEDSVIFNIIFSKDLDETGEYNELATFQFNISTNNKIMRKRMDTYKVNKKVEGNIKLKSVTVSPMIIKLKGSAINENFDSKYNFIIKDEDGKEIRQIGGHIRGRFKYFREFSYSYVVDNEKPKKLEIIPVLEKKNKNGDLELVKTQDKSIFVDLE